MNVALRDSRPAEPDSTLVECAIAEVLVIAQSQGVTPAEFVQLLDAGMQISDFLRAINDCTDRNLDRSRPAIAVEKSC